MTAKQLDEKIEKLGGSVEYPAAYITLPKKLKLKTKEEALNLMDVIIAAWDTEMYL